MKINVVFEGATKNLAPGIRIQCPGVDLSLTIQQAEALALAITTKIRLRREAAPHA